MNTLPVNTKTGNQFLKLFRRIIYTSVFAFLCLFCFAFIFFFYIPFNQEIIVNLFPDQSEKQLIYNDTGFLKKEIIQYKKILSELDKKILKKIPSRPYLIVNTTDNTFSLHIPGDTLYKGICSTGSYILLKGKDEQQWIFKTPRGIFTVKGKKTSPVWTKPDWAFIEEGLPVPPINSQDRYESGVLGDYCLTLGEGYMIHGTLYKRLLGMPVTHGCIRMDDEELKLVYTHLSVGSKVIIY